MTKKQIALIVLPVVSFALLYEKVIAKLVSDWSIDENYSHGFLVFPLALYFVWERRERLLKAPLQPSRLGLIVVLGSIAMLVAGVLGAEIFTTEISMLGVIAGSVLYVVGLAHLKLLLFPIAFLLLMIPLPAIIFNQITFPLQMLASRFGESVLVMSQIPVLREGNVIHLANTSLEVAEACSGIRSLITLLTLGIVYGYFMDARSWVRTGLALTTVPVAIVANGLRVAGTGIAAHHYGAQVAEGFFHSFSGWLVFIAAFLMLFAAHRVLAWKYPERSATPGRATQPLAAQ